MRNGGCTLFFFVCRQSPSVGYAVVATDVSESRKERPRSGTMSRKWKRLGVDAGRPNDLTFPTLLLLSLYPYPLSAFPVMSSSFALPRGSIRVPLAERSFRSNSRIRNNTVPPIPTYAGVCFSL